VYEEDVQPKPVAHNKSASDAALEFAKHLITLSSGVVALSATFVSRLTDAQWWSVVPLLLAWLSLTASVFGGLKTLSLVIKSRLLNTNDWSKNPGERWARLSRWAFLAGVVLFAVFATTVLIAERHIEVTSSGSDSPLEFP